MKFPSWFRYLWWIVLIVAVVAVIYSRADSVFGPQPTVVDILALALLAALATVPLFVEFKFGGLELKQYVNEAKQEIQGEIAAFRSEMKTILDVSNRLTQQIFLTDLPPSDERLKREEDQLRQIVDQALRQRGVVRQPPAEVDDLIEPVQRRLILGRAALEREVRRIWKERVLPFGEEHAPRRYGLGAMVGELVSEGAITGDLAHVIREVYSIGSSAVHGHTSTPTQIEFVDEILPGVLATLQSI